jgi:hydroxypyruvate reductase
LHTLHRLAREIFTESLRSVDAKEAVRRAVRLEDSCLKLVNTSFDLATHARGIYCVAIGKAALPMASALSEILGEHLTAGVIAAPSAGHSQTNIWTTENSESATRANVSLSDRWRVFEGGHPLPNRASLDASRAAFNLLRRAERERALVIFLISGGGSALMEWPRDEETTLEELRETHRALVSCGASIVEINAVRRAISAIKGGGLVLRAPHCDQVSLIVSDTNAGEEAIVASGPTFDLPADPHEAVAVVARYKLEASLPESMLRAIQQPFEKMVTPSEQLLREHYVLLDNEHALASAAAAARSRGLIVEVAHEVLEQPVAEGCSMLLSKLLDLSRRTGVARRGVCLISGGEFACPVRGPGFGGRNAESVLRWAIELDALAKTTQGFPHAVALSAGTDGVDGNSPAAGAICDETTLERARQLKLDAHHFLDESDAYTFFQTLNDTIITGPTGTNVRDVRIMLGS